MSSFLCGYNNINLIRRPFKKFSPGTNTNELFSKYKVQKLGDFDLVPLDCCTYYNKENQTFPVDEDLTGYSGDWWIYTISDPNVGVLIPHILKEKKGMFFSKIYNTDTLSNGTEISTLFARIGHEFDNNTVITRYSIGGYIFVQPIFLKKTSNWLVYVPAYKINDDDVVFTTIEMSQANFNNMFYDENSISDVVISDEKIDDMHFANFGIGKDGISLRNGLRYTIDNGGNVDFNVGNIKSDAMSFVLQKVSDYGEPISNATTIKKKIESSSHVKGDVLSGTAFSSLLSSILFDIYENTLDEQIYTTSTASTTATKVVSEQRSISSSNESNGKPFTLELKLENTATSQPKIKVTDTSSNSRTFTVTKFDDITVSGAIYIPAGRYNVTYTNTTTNPTCTLETVRLYSKINSFIKKVSNYDILLVKK